MRRLAHDPWRGLHAVAQHPFTISPPHSAYIPLTAGQQGTILSPPFWVWLDHGLLTGTYMVAVTTYCPTATPRLLADQPPSHNDNNNDYLPLASPDTAPPTAPSTDAPSVQAHDSDYLPPTAHSNAPPDALSNPAPVVQAPMAYLGLAPISAFMP